MIGNALVPELGVSDWRRSRAVHLEFVVFEVAYERHEEGFSDLTLDKAQCAD